MISKREARREALRIALLEAAKARVAENGLARLRARDIAKDAGCALGAVYNVYKSLDDLILHINSATLAQLNAKLRHAAANAGTPQEKLVALARQYMTFAIDNNHLWSALFDHRMPENAPFPQWHLDEQAVLFGHVVDPLAALKPDLDDAGRHIAARTLFAAVHGIVSISLREGSTTIPRETLDTQLTEFINTQVNGMKHAGCEHQS